MELIAFAKAVPQTPIILSNGRRVVFDSLDGQVGYTISADPGIISQLDNCIRNGIGDVRRIPMSEFEAFASKKKQPGSNHPKIWREELGANELSRPGAVAVAEARPTFDPQPAPAPVKAVAPPAAEPQVPFKPRTVKRKT